MPRLRLPFISRRKWDKLRDALERDVVHTQCDYVAYKHAGWTSLAERMRDERAIYKRILELLELIEHEK